MEETNQSGDTIDIGVCKKINIKKKVENRKEKRRNMWSLRKQRNLNTKEKMTQNHNNNTQYDDEELTCGYDIHIDNAWPNENYNNTLRIIHYNANGISPNMDYIEWETLQWRLNEIQADIYCLNELNLDTRNNLVQYKLREIAKKTDRHSKLEMQSSHCSPRTEGSYFKPGVPMIGIRGNWSGRMTAGLEKYKDVLGRWSIRHLRGRRGSTISIMSVYQVCKDSSGQNTAFDQQQTDYYVRLKKMVDPM